MHLQILPTIWPPFITAKKTMQWCRSCLIHAGVLNPIIYLIPTSFVTLKINSVDSIDFKSKVYIFGLRPESIINEKF